MKQEIKTMKADKSKDYISPILKVREIDTMNVLCTSGGNTNSMGFGSELGNDGFY